MSDYSVEVKPPARKELEALPDSVLARVLRKMETLRQTPRPAGCKKLRGYKDHWRVPYVIDDAAKHVSVTRIAHRSEVYEKPARPIRERHMLVVSRRPSALDWRRPLVLHVFYV